MRDGLARRGRSTKFAAIFVFMGCGSLSPLAISSSIAQVFEEAQFEPPGLPDLGPATATWGDYDGDGHLDLLLIGNSNSSGEIARIYRNSGPPASELTSPVDLPAEATNAQERDAAWVDFDRDGDLDIVTTTPAILGNDGTGNFATLAVFTATSQHYDSVDWADYDNDGDPDLVFANVSGGRLFRNDGPGSVGGPDWLFVEVNVFSVSQGRAVRWADYDNDGDADFFLTQKTGGAVGTALYQNDGSTEDGWMFTEDSTFLENAGDGSVVPGDYDGDGDWDLFLGGVETGNDTISRIYRSIREGTEVFLVELFQSGINDTHGLFEGASAWGDFDNDGDLDLFFTGRVTPSPKNQTHHKQLYQFVGPAFVVVDTLLEAGSTNVDGLIHGAVEWADYDRDGYLDLAIVGTDGGDSKTRVYRNRVQGTVANEAPSAPTNPQAHATGDTVTLSWSPATDDLTRSAGLTYNLRVGTTPGGVDIVSPLADPTTGTRWVADFGNAYLDTTWTIRNLAQGTYYWSVQAIDNGFIGSAFAEQGGFEIGTPVITTRAADSILIDAGESLTIEAEVTDTVGAPIDPARTVLHARRGGESTFTELPMAVSTVRGGSSFQTTVPAELVTSRGVEYFITAADSGGLSARIPLRGFFSLRVDVENVAKAEPQPHGSEQDAYRLVSLPLGLIGDAVSLALEDDLGTFDRAEWRLLKLERSQLLEEPVSEIEPGNGYWLIVRQAGKTLDTGPARSLPTNASFLYEVHPRWNFISNPFDFTIPVENLTLRSLGNPTLSGSELTIRSFPGRWNSTFNEPVTDLVPFEGYAFFNPYTTNFDDELFLQPDLSSVARLTPTARSADIAWRIGVLAKCQRARDGDNVAMVAADASRGSDAWDEPEPPTIGGFVSVSFAGDDGPLCVDARPPAHRGEVWHLDVETNLQDRVELTFEGITEVPADYEVHLVDDAIHASHDLRRSNRYEIAGPTDHGAKRLRLVIGGSDFVDAEIPPARFRPSAIELTSIPNPFRAMTTIRYGIPREQPVTLSIYDVLGRVVTTLVSGDARPPGYHVSVWDGSDSSGRRVASGVYFFRLESGREARTMKGTILR